MNLIQFAILFAVVAFCAGETPFCGTYERELKPDNKEFLDVLLGMGFSKENAETWMKSKVTMTIKENPDKTYSMNTVWGDKNQTVTITSGKEFDENLPDGRPFKGTNTIEGSTMHYVKKIGDIEAKFDYEFSKDGIKATAHVKDKKANFTWKRTSEFKP